MSDASHPASSKAAPYPDAGFETAPVDAEAAHLADAIVSRWQQMDAALRPVIGAGGVVALYSRGLSLAGANHPWLAGARTPGGAFPDATALKALFASQSGTNAVDGGRALMERLHELLVSLIGDSLTQRLLGPRWTPTISGFPAQDPTP